VDGAPGPLVDTPFLADGYFEVDAAGSLVRFNRRALELYGFDQGEIARVLAAPLEEVPGILVALNLEKVADPATFLAGLRRHLTVPDETVFDQLTMRDGRVLERYAVPLRGPDGRVTGRASYLRDVTARRAEVQELRERAERSIAIAELGELALLAEDLDALERLAVRLVERTLAADAVHFLSVQPDGKSLALRHANLPEGNIGAEPIVIVESSLSGYTLKAGGSVVSSDLVAEKRFVAPRLLAMGMRSGISCVVRGRDSPYGTLAAFWRRPRSLEQEEVRFVETAANVLAAALTRADAEARLLQREGEAREMQSRLALADRMASLGTLAAGVAHELNNPLAFVVANLTFVEEGLARLPGADPGGQLSEAIREAHQGAERMRGIIRDLRTFTRSETDGTGLVDVRKVLESCVSMAWSEIRHRARFVRDLAEVPPVRGDEGKLAQVFLNLLVNAAQAIPEGAAERNRIQLATFPRADGWVAVEVRDTGRGIEPDSFRRIFDPFFTTKPVGEGTGLGLTICHNIVRAMGGTIEVESASGQGSTFRVVLPAAEQRPAERAEQAGPPRARGRRGRVLVVDDEPLVGAAVRRALSGDHDVAVVGGGREALERLSAEEFDAVVCDLLMPEITGMDLYEQVRARFPRLADRMVFVTGGAFTPAARRFVEENRERCLEKPFEMAALREMVQRQLGA
jgi:signal transduction histidine kinase